MNYVNLIFESLSKENTISSYNQDCHLRLAWNELCFHRPYSTQLKQYTTIPKHIHANCPLQISLLSSQIMFCLSRRDLKHQPKQP